MKLLKWVGSKAAVAPQILDILPSKCRRFIEPMAGSAVIGLKMVAARRAEQLVLCDVNDELIHLYQTVQTNPTGVATFIRAMALRYNTSSEQQAVYKEWVAERNLERQRDTKSAARTVVINRSCFNGLFRVNAKGEFNTPWGKRDKILTQPLVSAVVETSALLTRAEAVLSSGQYDSWGTPNPGDVIYLDPPYDGTFSAYSSRKWSEADLLSIAAYAKRAARFAQVFVSNSDTPAVRAAFDGSTFHPIAGRSCVSQKSRSRGPRKELLIEVAP